METTCVETELNVSWLKVKLNKVEKERNRIVIYSELNKKNAKTKLKIVKKVLKLIKQNEKIIVSKEIKNDKEFMNLLYSQGLDIYTSKDLFRKLLSKVLDYIINYENLTMEETEIWITTNEYIEELEDLANNYKRINIVTNHIEKFKKIEEKLYDEKGIIVTLTNNKKKSLAKAKIIMNLDFTEETLNKYNIYDKAIIVNFEEKININKKRFNGILIDNYELNQNIDGYEKYYINDIIEDLEFRNEINIDDLKINKLITKNGTY